MAKRKVELIEHPVAGTALTLLGPRNRKEATHLSVDQRVAMAQRILEVGPRLPRYIDRNRLRELETEQAERLARKAAAPAPVVIQAGADELRNASVVKLLGPVPDGALNGAMFEIYQCALLLARPVSMGEIRRAMGKPIQYVFRKLIKLGFAERISF